jgi:starvation-inducible DNA-binding protein
MAAKTQHFTTRVGIADAVRDQMIELLNQHLADSLDLYTQTKQAHWNVKGMHFIGLHELFDKLAEPFDQFIDDIAERVTALGGTAMGTARMAAKASQLDEYPSDITDGVDHIIALVDRFAAYANTTREAIDIAAEAGDADTADLLTDISREIDKSLWFLEAHLQA